MDEQEKICVRCGQAYIEGQNFCSNCGAELHEREQNEYFWQKSVEKEEVSEPIEKPKRKTYKAKKFVSLGFAIFDIFLVIPFWICAVIFQEVSYMLYYDKSLYDVGSTEYMLSEYSDIYYALAGVCYFLAILFAVGSIISWIMFFVYSKKRRKFNKELESKALQEEIQELQTEEQEPLAEVSEEESQSEEQI